MVSLLIVQYYYIYYSTDNALHGTVKIIALSLPHKQLNLLLCYDTVHSFNIDYHMCIIIIHK